MSGRRPTCGRCGVYKHLHPIARCKGYRHSWWWNRHRLTKHVAVWAWIHLMRPSWRWSVCARMSEVGGGWRDWCRIIDSALYADDWTWRRGDYSGAWGCLCDFPMPWETGARDYRGCYCSPAREPIAERTE
jgi:hypothetical protein